MMDDLVGAMLDIDEGVAEIMAWIDANGGYEKNALYVTADHDHYLTLLPRKWTNQSEFLFYALVAKEILSLRHQISPKWLPT